VARGLLSLWRNVFKREKFEMTDRSVFVVDDDQSIRSYLSSFLTTAGCAVESFAHGHALLQRLTAGHVPSVILLDVLLPDMDGIEILNKIQKEGVRVPVIMLSGVSDIKTVVEAMKCGASDFLMKPFDEESLEAAIKESASEEVQPPRSSPASGNNEGFVTVNPQMLRLREIIKRVAHTDVPILILGESGSGKEVIARYAHENSGRGNKPFVKVNCAALPHELLESELFGYEKGAFTGAANDKPGKFELANGGTILLDEIGEMSPQLQAKLLHVLQDGTFSRLGGKKTLRVDARIIAATNIKLEEAIRNGKFREDLYFRLNVIRVDLPPLRERREDIPSLCQHFIDKYGAHYQSNARALPALMLERCLEHNWPGNIRELENFIKRFLVLPDLQLLPGELTAKTSARRLEEPVPPALNSSSDLLQVGAEAAELAQKRLVEQVLQETGGNRKKAAARLNICYKALLNKLKRWEHEGKQGDGPGTNANEAAA
jgi:two-component system, NtrC family, response regulator AtoC